MILASVVFPVPEGPKKIAESNVLFFMALYRSDPLYKKCSCPTKSSSLSGLILVDNGIMYTLFSFCFGLRLYPCGKRPVVYITVIKIPDTASVSVPFSFFHSFGFCCQHITDDLVFSFRLPDTRFNSILFELYDQFLCPFSLRKTPNCSA